MFDLFGSGQARLQRRLAVIKAHHDPAGAARRRPARSRLPQEDQIIGGPWLRRLRGQLAQAGLPVGPWACLAVCAALGVGVAMAALAMGAGWLFAGLGAVIAGMGLPRLVIGGLGARRRGRFTALFADAIDVVVRGIRSGLPLGECIAIIGRELPDPVGAEFRLIHEGQRLCMTLHDALSRAVERMPTAELRYFAIVISIQQQTGGNLADTLAKLSDVLRARKRMRDKVQALASEARTSAWIIGSLPVLVTLVLAVIAPDFTAILFHTATGHVLLASGGLTMAVGAMVMAKMIHFDL